MVIREHDGRIRDKLVELGYDAWSVSEAQHTTSSARHYNTSPAAVMLLDWDAMIDAKSGAITFPGLSPEQLEQVTNVLDAEVEEE